MNSLLQSMLPINQSSTYVVLDHPLMPLF